MPAAMAPTMEAANARRGGKAKTAPPTANLGGNYNNIASSMIRIIIMLQPFLTHVFINEQYLPPNNSL